METERMRKAVLAVLVVFALCVPVCAEPVSKTYVFVPDQSTVVQTGGIADINETHTISGMFYLHVDFDANTAWFDQVDANLSESIYLPTQSLGELFEMHDLNSTEVNETAIKFEDDNPPFGGIEINITVTFMGDSLHLTGSRVEPWLDGFTYDLDAVARHWADAEVVPPNPTSADVVAITVSGEWHNSCVPDGSDISVEGNDIYFNVFSSLGEVCAQVFTPWELTESVGRLSAGTYNVYVALDRGPFMLMLQFTVAGCVYYVDGVNGSDDNDGLSPETAFATIQKGIDSTIDGDTVQVLPGVYLDSDPGNPWLPEEINFLGKNIKLTSTDPTDWAVVKNTVVAGTVLFSGTEDANCALTGFTICDLAYGAIYGNHTHAAISHCVISGNAPCEATVLKNCDGTISNCLITDNFTIYLCGVYPVILGCHGVIKNCTITKNSSAIGVLDGGTTTIENCIIYHNGEPNIPGPQIIVDPGGTLNISYSDVQGGLGGISGDGEVNWGLGNIDADPCFVRLGSWFVLSGENEADYHLKSEGWRWDAESAPPRWGYDDVTSRCADAGNPGSPLRDEVMTVLPNDPNNDWGINLRINMGAYGGTAEASMPPYGWALLADLTNDGIVNWLDLGGQAEDWLESANEQPGNLNRDGVVDMIDFAMLAEEWMQEAVWKED